MLMSVREKWPRNHSNTRGVSSPSQISPFPPPSFSLLFPDHKSPLSYSSSAPFILLHFHLVDTLAWFPHTFDSPQTKPTHIVPPPKTSTPAQTPSNEKNDPRCSSSLSLIPATQGLSNVARIDLIFKLSQYYPCTSFLAPFSSAFSSASNHDSLPSKYRQAAPQSSMPFPYCSPARCSIGWPNSPERCQGLPLQSRWPTQLFFHGKLVW
ncbi:hypothetical protein K438DRAFT_584423 [Mycena galopus ATCC 62051]|nr:hypothetical protein K438DRAFT_584423 [Mycena galopus ATCC 62051]